MSELEVILNLAEKNPAALVVVGCILVVLMMVRSNGKLVSAIIEASENDPIIETFKTFSGDLRELTNEWRENRSFLTKLIEQFMTMTKQLLEQLKAMRNYPEDVSKILTTMSTLLQKVDETLLQIKAQADDTEERKGVQLSEINKMHSVMSDIKTVVETLQDKTEKITTLETSVNGLGDKMDTRIDEFKKTLDIIVEKFPKVETPEEPSGATDQQQPSASHSIP